MQYVIYKGYIAINGCSLTIGKVTKNEFSIHLIPETLEITNLSNIKIGDPLNIEIEQTTFTTVETIKKVLIQKRLKTK
jgi:riboflavin synthase